MSFAVQTALFLASVAIVALVACVLPIAFTLRRRMESLGRSADSIKADVQVLIREGREAIGNLNDLVKRLNAPMGDVSRVARTVRKWTEQAEADNGARGIQSSL